MDVLLVVVLGVPAGALTTVAGLGGGLLLMLALSLVWDPGSALAVTALALVVGNVHRAYLFRRRIDREVLSAFALGAVPGALVGALAVVSIPERAIHALMVFVTGLAVLRALDKLHWRPRRSQLGPGGAVIGTLCGAAGGAGILVGPTYLAAGLTGEAYVATTSATACMMHVSRIVGYGIGGLVTVETVALACAGAVAIVAGNLVGKRLRVVTEKAPPRSIEAATLVVCVTLAVAGVAH